MTLRIGSLFSGYGGLDDGVQAVLGGEIAWHCQYDPDDKYQYAARILAHHWPNVANLGDITRVIWQRVLDEHGPVDVLLGGFPCTDLSSIGKRAGLLVGTRSGLWHYMASAIAVLQPRLVVIENVRGILSTQARSGMEQCPCCVENAGRKPVLRALGAVLGDLARFGFDAEWAGVQAEEVGAPHKRFREFIIAWPAAADAAHLGHERGGRARDGRARSADGDQVAADALGVVSRDDRELSAGRDAVQRGVRHDAPRCGAAAADTDGELVRQQSVAEQRRSGTPVAELPCAEAAADADSIGRGEDERDVRAGQPDVEWGEYEPAIRRWETILGRPHPRTTDDRGRLAPEFSEWMMGLPEGHVCSVPPAPDMTEAALRNARLKALGNGVVPMQAEAAVRLLLDRVAPEVPLVRQLVEHADQGMRRAA
ncbi:DNA cytosine methyltransferase [Streptomyces mirabilis]|uniref:DNA cytosine methyltransferase n=1 Tax=Streptomyces mirabilis TaxID=68239 RepID=UPI002252CCF4|nr:DNA cytosine methyltransferase [Streptomyces mirabilis]MCX4615740.1 DNA cytosine methyltransferase [Streptomyces mirabilis]